MPSALIGVFSFTAGERRIVAPAAVASVRIPLRTGAGAGVALGYPLRPRADGKADDRRTEPA